MRIKIQSVLSRLEIHPILVDVGASGEVPAIWDAIAEAAIYVGFDPDLREMRQISNERFRQATIVNSAVVDSAEGGETGFYLTQSPYCSSTLPPDKSSLEEYLFSDLFTVVRSVKAKATTLNVVLDQLSLSGIDWLKVDTQGTDLRIFSSLNKEIQSKVLALDVEPGLIDAYVGEESFVDTHRELTKQGFWLAKLDVKNTVRMRGSTLQQAQILDKSLELQLVQRSIPQSPGWCEARYLRTLKSLAEYKLTVREYVLLWVFAIVDGQMGFALDVVVEYMRIFGEDDVSRIMREQTLNEIGNAVRRQRFLDMGRLLFRPLIKPFRRY